VPRLRAGRPLRYGALLAAAALASAAVPAALAAAVSAPVTYYACVTTKTGAVKMVSTTAACGTGQHKISWNDAGPKGATGARGPAGPRGLAGVVKGYQDTSNGAALDSAALTTVATLVVPSGTYIINADVSVAMHSATQVNCLVQGRDGDFDEVVGYATANTGGEQTIFVTMAATGSRFDLRCIPSDSSAFVFAANITAIPTVTNVTTTG
jgi:hypothetical protein